MLIVAQESDSGTRPFLSHSRVLQRPRDHRHSSDVRHITRDKTQTLEPTLCLHTTVGNYADVCNSRDGA